MWGSTKNYTQKLPLKCVDNLLKTVDKGPILWRSAYFMEKGEKYTYSFTPHLWGHVLILTCIFKESIFIQKIQTSSFIVFNKALSIKVKLRVFSTSGGGAKF
jgi:hypothetical protein